MVRSVQMVLGLPHAGTLSELHREKRKETVSQVTTPEKRKHTGYNPCVPQLSTAAKREDPSGAAFATEHTSEAKATRSNHEGVGRDTNYAHTHARNSRYRSSASVQPWPVPGAP